jgi:hypothetical protein
MAKNNKLRRSRNLSGPRMRCVAYRYCQWHGIFFIILLIEHHFFIILLLSIFVVFASRRLEKYRVCFSLKHNM